MSDKVIQIENLSKRYQLGAIGASNLREQIMNVLGRALSRKQTDVAPLDNTLWALKDINLEVQQGEVLGIIGHNGAGKSTLLKILSRIVHPTTGRIEINGRVASLLEVGTGFHPELTGRENIYMNAAILGMKRDEIRRKFDEIISFAEVEQFIDTPVKRYSSGMYMRLAFAVAAHLDPDVLIIDEVLSVGDAAFQRKSLGKMEDVRQKGRTVLFVSHNISAVRSLCSKCVWLNKGHIKMIGDVTEVVDAYMGLGVDNSTSRLQFAVDTSLRMQFLGAELLNDKTDWKDGEHLIVAFDYVIRDEIEDVMMAVEVHNARDTSVYYANDISLHNDNKRKAGQHRVELKIPVYAFAPGNYSIAFGFARPGHRSEHFPQERLLFHRKEPINNLSAHGIAWPSILYLPAEWTYTTRT